MKLLLIRKFLIADIEDQGKSLIMNNELQSSERCYKEYHENLVFWYKPHPSEHVLVLGSGEGVSINLLQRRGWKNITGVDIDPQAVHLIDTHFSDWNESIYKKN